MASQLCREYRRKVIIVGGGALGLSSGWHIANNDSNEVIIYDQLNEIAPSQDVSKIFRVDYPDPRRMRRVFESQDSWNNESVFHPFYFQTGRIVGYPQESIDTLDGIDEARSSLNLPLRQRKNIDYLKERYGSSRSEPGLTIVENEDDALLDWTGVMESIRKDCIKKGIEFRNEVVIRLISDEEGYIRDLITSSGSIDTTNTTIILANGPWILPLLDVSAIQLPPKSRAPVATGIFSFTIELNISQWEKYRGLPAFSEIGVGEFICHPKQPCSAKLTWIKPFSHPQGDKQISSPWDASDSNLALQSLLDARSWLRQTFPDLRGARIKEIRSWWDGVTEDQNPLIARHPNHANLLAVGGASYTHAKDLPVIGQIVASLLSGNDSDSFGWATPLNRKSAANQPALRATSDFASMEKIAFHRLQQRKISDVDYIV